MNEEERFLRRVWLSVYKEAMKRNIGFPYESANRAVEAAREEFFKPVNKSKE